MQIIEPCNETEYRFVREVEIVKAGIRLEIVSENGSQEDPYTFYGNAKIKYDTEQKIFTVEEITISRIE